MQEAIIDLIKSLEEDVSTEVNETEKDLMKLRLYFSKQNA